MLSKIDQTLATDLLEAIRFFNHKNWSPATSTNYSVRSSDPQRYIISRSGVDKSKFQLEDLILIEANGTVANAFQKEGVKSSAETEIHTALYQKYPWINCVLHTHSVLGTMLSQLYVDRKQLRFEGLEILKGLEGNTTHEMVEILPIVYNGQEMRTILMQMEEFLTPQPHVHGFLIAGHGLYTWGKDIATAKRHIETYEFLFECFELMRRKQWES